jgi:predicted CXXCH cytochrome family protein
MRCVMQFALVLGLAGAGSSQTGSEICATCHAGIYESYQRTPMAHSARKLDGSAGPERFDKNSFTHGPSGFRYRVSPKNSSYVFEFAKDGLSAAKPLAYAVGSGTRAFSYLLEDDGFLYEAPVAYYSGGHSWGLAPGYDAYSYPYLTRPIVPGCLACHASSLQVASPTLNRYTSPAFLEGGVACERCHGDGARHIAKMKSGDRTGGLEILQPAKLAPERRDSLCAQCHLTGAVRVMRPGADWRSFHPGGVLSDYQTVFVRSPVSAGLKVTGHVEDLALSACKRKAGDKLWCGTCHDPHLVPPPAEAAAWFRERCLSCHTTKGCTETPAVRAQAKDDCVGCHMPKGAASDAQHVVFTDHSIPRRPARKPPRPAAVSEAALTTFDGAPARLRDQALAYAIAAVGRTSGADRTRAIPLLEQAAKENPSDVEVLLYLAEIYRNDGKNDLARPLYQRAIALDPNQATASVGLGGILMESGEYREAIRLWTDALSKNAGLELVRLNLAVAYLKIADRISAELHLRKALDLNPAFAPARELLKNMQGTAPK